MSRIIKLAMLLNEVLNEVGDLKNIEPVPYTDIGNDRYYFKYEGMDVDVMFEYYPLNEVKDTILPNMTSDIFNKARGNKNVLDLDCYNLTFTVNNEDAQATKVPLSVLYTILSTVVKIAKEFVEKEQPFLITIFSASKFGSIATDKQKAMLYKEISKQNLPSDYYLRDIKLDVVGRVFKDYQGFEGLVLFRKN